jgi:hypothetical protein
MAVIVVLGFTAIISGAIFGAYLVVCRAICRADRQRGSLPFDPSGPADRAARSLVGINGSRWD